MIISPTSTLHTISRAAASFAVAVVFSLHIVPATPVTAVTQATQGLQAGWAIDDNGNLVFYHSAATQFPIMKEAGAGWVRINFRLGACYRDWTTAGCNGRTAIQQYTQVVKDARAQGLLVVGLLSNESWHGSQSEWNTSNAEKTRGSGDNAYIRSFAQKAASPLASHFNGAGAERPLVTQWEIWNEPNAWTYRDASGEPAGGTYLYPSNFAWLLKRSRDAIRASNSSAVIISGGVFAHDPAGASVTIFQDGSYQRVSKRGELQGATRATFAQARANRTTTTPPSSPPTAPSARGGSASSHSSGQAPELSAGAAGPVGIEAVAGTKCADSVFTNGADSGHDYLCLTYQMGFSKAKWGATAPFDQIGQHFYIDESGPTSEANITRYLADLRAAYIAYEGASTTKRTLITEFGWRTEPGYVDEPTQASNLQVAFQTFAKLGYIARGFWFTAQDVPEGNIFFGLARGDFRAGDPSTVKPSFAAYQTYAR